MTDYEAVVEYHRQSYVAATIHDDLVCAACGRALRMHSKDGKCLFGSTVFTLYPQFRKHLDRYLLEHK